MPHHNRAKNNDSLTYVNQFLGLSCAPELVKRKIYPNAKEITESMACYTAVMYRGSQPLIHAASNKDYRLWVIGDGSSPRTAALFAYRSRWTCHSVDPRLGLKKRWTDIPRCYLIKDLVENLKLSRRELSKTFNVIVLPHAHVDLFTATEVFYHYYINKLVVMPCCSPYAEKQQSFICVSPFVKPHPTRREPNLRYEDPLCLSPKREILIWD